MHDVRSSIDPRNISVPTAFHHFKVNKQEESVRVIVRSEISAGEQMIIIHSRFDFHHHRASWH